MSKVTEKELISYSEVYDVYLLYSKEAKTQIPQDFVKKIESIVTQNPKYIGKIKSFEDLDDIVLTDEARNLIVYMGLNI